MRSFAIDEPGSSVRALYATLVRTTMKMFMSLTATAAMRAPETVKQRTPQPSQMITTTTTMTKPPVRA